MAEILEESENTSMDRIATVRTSRGEEVIINVDATIKKIADLWSDHKNERRAGWTLTEVWYKDSVQSVLNQVRS